MVLFGKRCGTGLALGAMCAAPLMANASDGLYLLLQTLNGIFNVPIFIIVSMGLLTKRVPALAAKVVLILGPILYILLVFVIDIDIHFLHTMGLLGAINITIMLIIRYVKPQKEIYYQKYTGQVDITPWKYRKSVSIFIAIATLLFFVFLAEN